MYFPIFFLAAAASLTLADMTYKSRPDLNPIKLNITIPCDDLCEPGYLFVAPFSGTGVEAPPKGPAQQGAYIIRNDGDLVWDGYTYFSPWTGNFQAARWNGSDIIFAFEGSHNGLHGHGHGRHVLLNQNYEVIRSLRAGGHFISDKHEFIIINEKTALFQIYQPLQMDLSSYGGDVDQTWIVDAIFQEVDIESGCVLFEWRSLDFVTPNETSLPLPLGQAGSGTHSTTAWDYFHINSITKGDDGHYLLSARHASTIYKINGTDGSIIWRLGGTKSDFVLGQDVPFGFQHHARYLAAINASTEVISLFDNSFYGSESAGGGDKAIRLHPFSRGKYIALNHESGLATLLTAFHPPKNSILSKSQGSLQTLPGGGALLNWGSEGQLTEYTSKGDIAFHAGFGDGPLGEMEQHNYRAFRYNWTGISAETPAVYAEEVDAGTVILYVSWNSDTRTSRWRFSWKEELESHPGQVQVKNQETRRTGFETSLTIQSRGASISQVVAEALDVHDNILARSDPVSIAIALPKLQRATKRPLSCNGSSRAQE
ncbi:hypothetical protein BN1723_018185 [Verticillium longisporum]|uniref:Arylsulfotransferase N-terminal domain-containing protein n=1 Tax=Verticillium longisporum TaxID=100787 RepID=A0A0G4LSH9_VERLO|nr:hypothetical protein HYQ44_011777 [Verticillium longisporum]CRK25008.1 hypothetical protein BN1723_018185 [Verticillium longisporum]